MSVKVSQICMRLEKIGYWCHMLSAKVSMIHFGHRRIDIGRDISANTVINGVRSMIFLKGAQMMITSAFLQNR